MTNPDREALERPWTIGDYSVIARHLLPISTELVSTVKIRPGDRVLDIGVGTANAAIEAARLGAQVTGVDLASAQIERCPAPLYRRGRGGRPSRR